MDIGYKGHTGSVMPHERSRGWSDSVANIATSDHNRKHAHSPDYSAYFIYFAIYFYGERKMHHRKSEVIFKGQCTEQNNYVTESILCILCSLSFNFI